MNETTFENARVGDRVWDSRYGWGKVVGVHEELAYPLMLQFTNCAYDYLFSGCVDEWSLRTLFWDEIKFEAPPRPKRMVKKVVEEWVNIYMGGTSACIYACIYKTKESASNGPSGSQRCGEPLFIHHEYEVEE